MPPRNVNDAEATDDEPPMSPALLELQQLSCGYGAVSAVEGLDLAVDAGALHALAGPNGAGKTSTLLAIMGHVALSGGRILFAGEDIGRARPADRVDLGIAIVPEGRRLFTDLSVRENLVVGGYRRPRAAERRNRERVFAIFPRLAERAGQIAGSLSGGEQQMLAFGRALMVEPKLLLVDELSLGLMPAAVAQFIAVLISLKAEGVSILLVEQNTERVLRIADALTVLVSGRRVFGASGETCRSDPRLFQRYLGETELQ